MTKKIKTDPAIVIYVVDATDDQTRKTLVDLMKATEESFEKIPVRSIFVHKNDERIKQ